MNNLLGRHARGREFSVPGSEGTANRARPWEETSAPIWARGSHPPPCRDRTTLPPPHLPPRPKHSQALIRPHLPRRCGGRIRRRPSSRRLHLGREGKRAETRTHALSRLLSHHGVATAMRRRLNFSSHSLSSPLFDFLLAASCAACIRRCITINKRSEWRESREGKVNDINRETGRRGRCKTW